MIEERDVNGEKVKFDTELGGAVLQYDPSGETEKASPMLTTINPPANIPFTVDIATKPAAVPKSENSASSDYAPTDNAKS